VAGAEKTTSNLPIKTSANASDRVVFIANAASANSNTATIAILDMLTNTPNLSINVTQLQVVSSLGSPANSSVSVVPAGVIWTDGTYLYYSTANNFVKRVTGADF
jgi:hypothetical protein